MWIFDSDSSSDEEPERAAKHPSRGTGAAPRERPPRSAPKEFWESSESDEGGDAAPPGANPPGPEREPATPAHADGPTPAARPQHHAARPAAAAARAPAAAAAAARSPALPLMYDARTRPAAAEASLERLEALAFARLRALCAGCGAGERAPPALDALPAAPSDDDALGHLALRFAACGPATLGEEAGGEPEGVSDAMSAWLVDREVSERDARRDERTFSRVLAPRGTFPL